MDIYRYFHPHHNPRLHHTPLRQQELSELEQAALELLKAIKRARARANRAPVSPILPQHFDDSMKALEYVVDSLEILCDAHSGDSALELNQLVQERSESAGWEVWSNLLREQLVLTRDPQDTDTDDLSQEKIRA